MYNCWTSTRVYTGLVNTNWRRLTAEHIYTSLQKHHAGSVMRTQQHEEFANKLLSIVTVNETPTPGDTTHGSAGEQARCQRYLTVQHANLMPSILLQTVTALATVSPIPKNGIYVFLSQIHSQVDDGRTLRSHHYPSVYCD